MEVEVRADRAEKKCEVTGVMEKVLPNKREVFAKTDAGFRLVGWFMADVQRAPLNLIYPFGDLAKVQIEEAVRREYPNVLRAFAPPRDIQKQADEDDDE